MGIKFYKAKENGRNRVEMILLAIYRESLITDLFAKHKYNKNKTVVKSTRCFLLCLVFHQKF
ncbi:MAG: hypothetical protein GY760_06510 [Deltaproteobacteria bacterium]|nr:hypothetical protein [Deltaproteobacteria bacterium]